MGLDQYVKLLEQTILELKGEARDEAPRATLKLRLDLRIPPDYVPETHQRLTQAGIMAVTNDGEAGKPSLFHRFTTG